MDSRFVRYAFLVIIGLSLVMFLLVNWAQQGNEGVRKGWATQTAVARQTIDASSRMREALAASIGARAITLSQTDPQAAMLVALEATNVLKAGDNTPRALQHAFWQTLTAETGLALTGPGAANNEILFSPDDRWLVAYSPNEPLARLWDLSQAVDADDFFLLAQHTGAIQDVAFSPDSRWLATGSVDTTAVLYDLHADNPADSHQQLTGHTRAINALAFSTDGEWLVTASDDHSLRLYPGPFRREELSDKAIILQKQEASGDTPTQEGHTGSVLHIAFSPDSGWLASGSADGTIRLWSLADNPQQNPVLLDDPGQAIAGLTFSNEGRRLLATNANNQLFVWHLERDTLKERACAKVGRNLTEAEWAQYLPELRYRETCKK